MRHEWVAVHTGPPFLTIDSRKKSSLTTDTTRMMRRRSPHYTARTLLILFAVVAASCTGQEPSIEEADGTGLGADLPTWLSDVQPAPGAEMSSVSVVEVVHTVRAVDRDVRLLIDGVDVTAEAETARGRLHYEPSRGGPVELDSGTHRAELQLIERKDPTSQGETVDTFSWQFTVL